MNGNYYMLHCFSPKEGDLAMLTYKRDTPLRSWASGKRFTNPPPQPVRAEVKPGYSGIMAEFWSNPVPLMTKRLHKALLDSGVANLDTYAAEIFDPKGKKTYSDYVAFNIIGVVAAADLKKSKFDAGSPDRMVSMDFDSVSIDAKATGGALMFRLAESVNAIVVHEKIKTHIEANGIDTLTFVVPEDWAG